MVKRGLTINSNDHHKGNLNAKIVLIEYGDFECPYCRRAHVLIKRLLEEKGEELRFAFRNFPLREIHPHAYASAITAEAAGKQGKFWEIYDLIFENQEKLNPDFLLTLVRSLGLNLAQFERDQKNEEVESKIEMDFETAIRYGVNGTPTFFLNGHMVSTYDETYESLLWAVTRPLTAAEIRKVH